MGTIRLHSEVRYRDDFGRYIALYNAAGYAAASELAEVAASDAAELAPVGPARADYGRRPKLSRSIEPVAVGKTGHVISYAGHAGAQEYGARPHPIPNAFGSGRVVIHPGNAPQPYLRPALQQLRTKALAILRRLYPG